MNSLWYFWTLSILSSLLLSKQLLLQLSECIVVFGGKEGWGGGGEGGMNIIMMKHKHALI